MPIISMIRQIEGVLIFVIPIDNPTVPIAEANSKAPSITLYLPK